jgi:hypothetical protein
MVIDKYDNIKMNSIFICRIIYIVIIKYNLYIYVLENINKTNIFHI